MPKLGMEKMRRQDLIAAARQCIATSGSLKVTMAEIARAAAVSPGLAHFYFQSKEQLILATFTSLLAEYRADLLLASRQADTPRQKLSAFANACFSEKHFTTEAISVWLVFFASAKENPEIARLFSAYARRTRSNLRFVLGALAPAHKASFIAEGIAAMVDGLYIAHSLESPVRNRSDAVQLLENYVDIQLAGSTAKENARA
ncbi:transcriptional regulator BetI [Martelella alba]|uniref:HTH-type transcriptional regulator BetI n=1 Tax=Martelella alba TaxID=2590451 RepID=A0A506U828_9HYPH|nr:transcriptional regulator BetI [Martelella alba]TPW30572.1 transcriptional regulator BetI [Martelella alba]